MPLPIDEALGQRFLFSFTGKRKPSPDILRMLRTQHVGGIVLFRARNMGTLAELRGLTAALQQAAADAGQPPLLIAADQEGGQLMAIGDATPFPGNLALGATRSEKLARQVGGAIARELAALGINVDFAPVCDVNINRRNPVVGTRSFGEDPSLVGRLAAAFVHGMQSAGVAATAKHFPGHGDTASDSHHAAPVLEHDAKRLRRVELPPFQAAIDAGVRLVMTAHIVIPALNGGTDLPATLSPHILRGLLRSRLRFRGVIATDAMDMKAIAQGPGLVGDTIAALAAGADLVLLNHDLSDLATVRESVIQAARRGLLHPADVDASARRILALKSWLKGSKQPPLSIVGCREHRALAQEVAERSITLVRDTNRQIPLRLPPLSKIAVAVPRPEDLTPADTSSYLVPNLAAAVRRHHAQTDSIVFPVNPSASEMRALRDRLAPYDLVILGTINATAHRGQASLVNALLRQCTPVIAVALRMPYDLAAYPTVKAYLCTYSIVAPSMSALADALWGRFRLTGHLPVTVR